MAVTRLTLTHFRNHRASDIAAAPGLVLLHGDNGAGKTNILEALSLLKAETVKGCTGSKAPLRP